MPPVDAGSISSEVRIRLDKLHSDKAEAISAFDSLGREFAEKAEKYSTLGGQKYTNSLRSIAKEMRNVEGAAKAGALTETQAVERLIDLRKTELKILQDKAVKEGTASSGTVAAIKNTMSAISDLQEKQQILGGGLGGGSGLAGKFALLRDVMLGPVAVAKEVVNSFAAIKQKADELENAHAAQADALALLDNTLRATGADAWTTSKHLQEVASALQDTTKYGDETIENMQAVLLGFRNIQGITFDRTTEAVLDMATVMKMDLTSAAQAVGKALDSPVNGMDSLTRQGFKFTEQEKATIKALVESGDLLKAQDIILKELEKTYGGASKAVGALDVNLREKLKNAIGDVNEEIGRSISRNLAPFREWWLGIAKAVGAAAKAQNDFSDAMDKVQAGSATTEDRLVVETKQLESLRAAYVLAKGAAGGLMSQQQKDALAQSISSQAELVRGIQLTIKYEQAAADAKAKKDAEAEAAAKKAAEEQAKLNEFLAKRNKILEEYSDSVEKTNRLEAAGAIDYSQAEEDRIAAMRTSIDALNDFYQTDKNKSPETLKILKERIALYQRMTGDYEKYKAFLKEIAEAEKQSGREGLKKYEDMTKNVESLTEKLARQTSELNNGSLSLDVFVAGLIEEARAAGVSEVAIQKLIEAKAELDGAMKDKTASEQFQENMQNAADAVGTIASSIADIFSSVYQRQTEELTQRYELERELIENDGRTKREALEDQLAAAKEAGDEETAADVEKQITLLNLEEKYNKERAKLQYKADMAQWRAKLVTQAADMFMAIQKAVSSAAWPLNLPAIAFNTAASVAQGAALAASKPTLQAASGGIVLPRAGGVPVNTAENGSAELLLNDSAEGSAMIGAFAEKIVQAMGALRGGAQTIALNVDGREMARVVSRYQESGQA